MSTSAKTGIITTTGSTGNLSVSGLGFQPKVVIFWGGSASLGPNPGLSSSFGFATSSSARRCISARADNNVTPSHCDFAQTDTKCINVLTTDGVVLYAADFVSMDADGFTVNFTTANSGRDVHWLALGGSDISNVGIGTFSLNTSTGNQAVTGVGFAPDCEILAWTATANAIPASGNDYLLGIGFGSSSSQFALMGRATDNSNPSKADRAQLTNAMIAGIDTDETYIFKANYVSQDSDGFTFNLTTAPATAMKCFYLAFKGIFIKSGAFNQSTSIGNQAITGLGFAPIGHLFFSVNNTTSSSVNLNSRFTQGCGVSSSNRGFSWGGIQDNIGTAVATEDSNNDACIKTLTEHLSYTSAVVTSKADFVSNDSDGFTINNTTVDATSREIIYLSFGSATAAAKTGSESLSLSITEASSVVPALSVSETLSLSITESSANALSSGVSENLLLSITEAVSIAGAPSTIENLALSITETASIVTVLSPTEEAYYRRYLNDI